MTELLALTIKQPMLWAISHGPKRIENRTEAPPPNLIGSRLALHASKEYEPKYQASLTRRIGRFPTRDQVDLGAIVAVATVVRCDTASSDSWFTGPYGWVLDDVKVLRYSVPARGSLGLWRVLPEQAAQVWDQLACAHQWAEDLTHCTACGEVAMWVAAQDKRAKCGLLHNLEGVPPTCKKCGIVPEHADVVERYRKESA